MCTALLCCAVRIVLRQSRPACRELDERTVTKQALYFIAQLRRTDFILQLVVIRQDQDLAYLKMGIFFPHKCPRVSWVCCFTRLLTMLMCWLRA